MPLDTSNPDPLEDVYQKNRFKPAVVIAVLLFLAGAVTPLYLYLLPMIQSVQGHYDRATYNLVAPPEYWTVSPSFTYDADTREITVGYGTIAGQNGWVVDRVWLRVEELGTTTAPSGDLYRHYGAILVLPAENTQSDVTTWVISPLYIPSSHDGASLVDKKLFFTFTYRWKAGDLPIYRDMRVSTGWFTVPAP